MKTKLSILTATLLCVGFIIGCTSTQLDPAGVYAGKAFLYSVDTSLANAKDDLNTFVTWEWQNRSLLESNKLQSVTVAADTIRNNAPLWFAIANASRNTYVQMLTNAATPIADLNTASNNLVVQSAILVNQASLAKAVKSAATQ